jgi:NAD(P)-dependent dehydrogenase (short-subunit alcohol dehydrogenase family)
VSSNKLHLLINSSAFISRGRLIFLGSGSNGDGLLAYTASKNSVEGTACALRDELKPYGVSVVTLDSSGVPAEALYKSPIPFSKTNDFQK